MQNVTEAARFVAGDNPFGSLTLLSNPPKEGLRSETLRRLRRLVVYLLNNDVLTLVNVKSELENFRLRVSVLVRCGSGLLGLVLHINPRIN